jgi:hypothetical protein
MRANLAAKRARLSIIAARKMISVLSEAEQRTAANALFTHLIGILKINQCKD